MVRHCGDDEDHTCHASSINDERHCHFAYRTQATEISPAQVSSMFNIDFNERHLDDKMSIQDRRFLKIAKDGHFELPLPFKDDAVLPNNRSLALKRLESLKARLTSNTNNKNDYVASMKYLIDKGYEEKVPVDENPAHGSVWYIPHHAVYQAKKDKIRVVFDCSAEYREESLNHHLPRPDQ